ncbi:hypothetical protein [Algivirga pacifica]|uniref:Uncharacterized protein n=1 Tax=Algivirga pacifica TaxID=1162670 RepID=A0ABP9DAJ8_9BACT
MTGYYYYMVWEYFEEHLEIIAVWIPILFFTVRQLLRILDGEPLNNHKNDPNNEEFRFYNGFFRAKKSTLAIYLSLLTVMLVLIYSAPDLERIIYSSGLLLAILSFHLKESIVSIQFIENRLILGGRIFKSNKIKKVEVWNDVIVIHRLKGKPYRFELIYSSKNFTLMTSMLYRVHQFCDEHGILIEDQFEYVAESNEELYSNKW